jgi:hypothetical protein
VVVTAASVTDSVIGVRLLDKVVEHTATVTRAWVNAEFKRHLGIHHALLGVDVEVVNRSDTSSGFLPIGKRRVVIRALTRSGPSRSGFGSRMSVDS